MAFKFNFIVDDVNQTSCNKEFAVDKGGADQKVESDETITQYESCEIFYSEDDFASVKKDEESVHETLHVSDKIKLLYLPSKVSSCLETTSVSDGRASCVSDGRASCGTRSNKPPHDAESDLVPHVYEGGLKIWECSVDLVHYLAEEAIDLKDKNVLELGCGAGLPGLLAATQGAKHVVFQDYNKEVIQTVTIPNAIINNLCARDEKHRQCRFFSGEWMSFKNALNGELNADKNKKYDYILTSETVYTSAYYESLHGILEYALAPAGIIYLAAKTYYFGVGGGIREFEQFINKKKVFKSIIKKEFNEGVKREILQIEFIT